MNYNLELKGIITIPKNSYDGREQTTSLSCCTSLPKIMIGDKDLHDELKAFFDADEVDQFENYNDAKPLKEFGVKYVILDKAPKKEISFNDASADVINGMMIPDYVSGCYSEYTCGYGDFDFLVNEHSIFDELKEHTGKYIHLVL